MRNFDPPRNALFQLADVAAFRAHMLGLELIQLIEWLGRERGDSDVLRAVYGVLEDGGARFLPFYVVGPTVDLDLIGCQGV